MPRFHDFSKFTYCIWPIQSGILGVNSIDGTYFSWNHENFWKVQEISKSNNYISLLIFGFSDLKCLPIGPQIILRHQVLSISKRKIYLKKLSPTFLFGLQILFTFWAGNRFEGNQIFFLEWNPIYFDLGSPKFFRKSYIYFDRYFVQNPYSKLRGNLMYCN